MKGRSELPCWAALCILAALVLVALFAWNYPKKPDEWSAWAAGAQAVASAIAIVWAGRQGVRVFKQQREIQEKAAVELAVKVLRGVHTHLLDIGKKYWWPGDRLRNVAKGDNFFRIDYLNQVERLLDQINLEHLGSSPCIQPLLDARMKIWRIKDLLTWAIERVDKVEEYESNGVPRFDMQSEAIKKQVSELGACLSVLIECMKAYQRIPQIDS